MRTCEICGMEILAERLECVPDTNLCAKHAAEITKYGGEFIVTGVQGNIGKAGSLKKNYGDVSTFKSRNQNAINKLRQDYLGE